MKILCCSMGSSINVAMELQQDLSRHDFFYYFSDKEEFTRSGFVGENYLSEWQLISSSFDDDSLKFSDAGIRNQAYLMDRRLSGGKFNGLFGKLEPKYGPKQIEKILSFSFGKLNEMLDNFTPEVCIFFSVTTFGDYLIYELCRKKDIRTLIVRGTKIENYVNLFASLTELGNDIGEHTKTDIAKKFIESSRLEKIDYEGSLKHGLSLTTCVKKLAKAFAVDVRRYTTNSVDKHHKSSLFVRELFKQIVFPFRHKYLVNKNNFVLPDNYIFFPLHAEPEIALQLNNVKGVRQYSIALTLADQLPADQYLIVKEHPRNFGQKGFKFYSELLHHPRVMLIFNEFSTTELIKGCAWVFTLSGSCALESMMHKKPVITYSQTYYEVENMCMETSTLDMKNLYKIVSMHKHDECKLEDLICKILNGSRRINLYTELYRKYDRLSRSSDIDSRANLRKLLETYL